MNSTQQKWHCVSSRIRAWEALWLPPMLLDHTLCGSWWQVMRTLKQPYGESHMEKRPQLTTPTCQHVQDPSGSRSPLQMTVAPANILTGTSGDILIKNHTAEGHLNSWPWRINVCCVKLLHFGVIWKTNIRRNCLNSHIPSPPSPVFGPCHTRLEP